MGLAIFMAVALQVASEQPAPYGPPAPPPVQPKVTETAPASPTPEAMIEVAKDATSVTRGDPCADRRKADPNEIVVCKARDSAFRLPLPDERGPPDGPRRRTGDVTTRPPGAPCPPGGCTGINLFKVPGVLLKIVQKVIDPDS